MASVEKAVWTGPSPLIVLCCYRTSVGVCSIAKLNGIFQRYGYMRVWDVHWLVERMGLFMRDFVTRSCDDLTNLWNKVINVEAVLRPSPPHTNVMRSPCDIVANLIDHNIVVSEFEFQMCCCIHFQINTLGKGMNTLIPPPTSYGLNDTTTVLPQGWLLH